MGKKSLFNNRELAAQQEQDHKQNDGQVRIQDDINKEVMAPQEGPDFQMVAPKAPANSLTSRTIAMEQEEGLLHITSDMVEKAGRLRISDPMNGKVLFDSVKESIDPATGQMVNYQLEDGARLQIEVADAKQIGNVSTALAVDVAMDYTVEQQGLFILGDRILNKLSVQPVGVYSLRRMDNTYEGPVIEITIDGQYVYDIDFAGNFLDWSKVDSRLEIHGETVAKVSKIYDQVGQNHLVQATVADMPVLDTEALAIRFDNSQNMTCSTLQDFPNDLSVFSVAQYNHQRQPIGNYDYVYFLGIHQNGSTATLSRAAENWDHPQAYYTFNSGEVVYGEQVSGQNWQLFSQEFSSSAPHHTYYVNSDPKTSIDYSYSGTIKGTLMLGSYYTGAHSLDGCFREIVLFDQKLSKPERLLFEADAGKAWRIEGFIPAAELKLNLTLEGPFNGTEMTTALNSGGHLPLDQPFAQPPWSYFEAESVASIPNADVVDWILVECRRPESGLASDAIDATVIQRKAAFLLKNGDIVDLDGSSPLYILEEEPFFVVLYHRNHLPVMSSEAIVPEFAKYTWNFDAADKAHLLNGKEGLKDLGNGNFAMYAGNPDGDRINAAGEDTTYVLGGNIGQTGYLPGDLDLSGTIDAADAALFTLNVGSESSLPEEAVYPDAILDKVSGSVAAFALRRLSKNYHGPCIRIKLEDFSEHDIGFNGQNLDWDQVSTIAGAGTAYLVGIYDQSGHSGTLRQKYSGFFPEVDATNRRINFDSKAMVTGTAADLANKTTIFNLAQFIHNEQPNGNFDYVYFYGEHNGGGSTLSLSRSAKDFTPANSYYSYSASGPHFFGSVLPGETWQIMVQTFSDVSPTHRFHTNFLEDSNVDDYTHTLNLTGDLYIGSLYNNLHFLEGYWREFIAFDDALNDSDRTEVELDLDLHWEVVDFDPNLFGATIWLDPNDKEHVFEDTYTSPDTVRLIADKSTSYSLGPELMINGDFSNWTDPTFPDNWILSTAGAGGYVEESPSGHLHFVTDGTNLNINQTGLTIGNTYRVEVSVVSISGVLYVGDWGSWEARITVTTPGLHVFHFQPLNNTSFILMRSGAVDAVIDYVSVKEVQGNHAVQNTKANMFELETVSGINVLKATNNNTIRIPYDVSFENQDFTIFLVFQRDDPTRHLDGGLAMGSLFGSLGGYSWQIELLTNQVRSAIQDSSMGDATAVGNFNNPHWVVFEARYDQSLQRVYLNGELRSQENRTLVINYMNTHNIFLNKVGFGLEGAFGDMIYFPTALADHESAYVHQQLMAKYGIKWAQDMYDSYFELHPHESYSDAAKEELLARLQPGNYLYDEFGPNKQNKQVCDFVYLLEFETGLTNVSVTKGGEAVRWDVDGDIETTNTLPHKVIQSGGGVLTLSSEDGWGALTEINLASNDFVRTLPNFNFPNCTHLNASDCQFSGTVPNLSLPELTHLYLHGNQLSGDLPLFDLPKVEFFHLYDNSLTGTCPNFDLPAVKQFYIYSNSLTGNLPLFNFPTVEKFHVHNNGFDGTIPAFSFPACRTFETQFCAFTGVGAVYLPGVLIFRIDNNSISGTCPAFSFSVCKEFRISYNSFSGVCPLFTLPLVELFRIESNQFSGDLPTFDFPIVEEFQIQQNQFSGACPVYDFPECTKFYLFENSLTGISLMNLPKVENFFIYQNSFTGLLPAFDFPECEIFTAYDCAFTSIDKPLLPKVKDFKIHSNSIAGACPAFDYQSCNIFYIYGNDFSGTCPNFDMPVMVNFRIQFNSFSGPCPNFNFPGVDVFFIHYNQFSGVCPAFDFPGCLTFYISGNNFSGKLPDFNLPGVERYHVEDNDFYYYDSGSFGLLGYEWDYANNNLDASSVDAVLYDLHQEIGNRAVATIDLSGNSGPSPVGTAYKNDLVNAGFTVITEPEVPLQTWAEKMRDNYLARNSHGAYSQAARDELLLRLSSGYLYDTFGPDSGGLNKQTCDFLYMFEFTGNITTRTWSNAGGDLLHWNMNGNEVFQNNFPSATAPSGGIATVSSTSGWHNITRLDMFTNTFTGPIPAFEIPNCTEFNIQQNDFNGNFPYLYMPLVTEFEVNHNAFIGACPAFDFPVCTRFDLTANSFSGTCPNFNLPEVIDFRIRINEFSGEMPNFNLPKVQYIYHYQNNFTGTHPPLNLPECIGFYGYDNDFDACALMTLPKVQIFRLHTCPNMTGLAPAFDFPECIEFEINYNNFTGTCPHFNLPKVVRFEINHNNFTGICPPFSFPFCTWFDLTVNNFNGDCPNFYLPEVVDFRIRINNFTGDMPNFDLPKVKYVYYYNNNFTGTHPALDWPECLFLYGYNNDFTGCSNMTLPKVRIFKLHSCDVMTGPCPPFDFPFCENFEINNNNFTGECPNFNLPLVEDFRINHNSFSGTCPNFDFPVCTYFDLTLNQFSGFCPNFNLPQVDYFQIRLNQFSGYCPDFDFPEATSVIFNDNNFSGKFPSLNVPKAQLIYGFKNNFSYYDSGTIGDSVHTFYAYNNDFDPASIDAILGDFIEGLGTRVTANIQLHLGNQGPTQIGEGYKDTLVAAGFTVLVNATVTMTWAESMYENYLNRNFHASYSQNALDEFLLRLQSGYLYDTFGPESAGQDKKTCDFVYLMEFDGQLYNRPFNKNGDPLRWDADGNETFGNGLPNASPAPGGGVLTLSSTDGWDGITSFILSSNNLTGPCPKFEFYNTVYMTLNHAGFTGFCPVFNLPNADQFVINNNGFTGELPKMYLPKARLFYFNHNDFSSLVDQDLPEVLQFYGNNNVNMTGEMPGFNFPKCVTLRLYSTAFTSMQPPNLPSIVEYRIDSSDIAGPCPAFDFPECTTFYISNNEFSGICPNFNLPKVVYFYIHLNQFSGTIPNFNFPEVVVFYNYSNQFSGPIPNFDFPKATHMYMYFNQFSSVPLLDLPKVQYFYLNNNQLTGALPAFDFPECLRFRVYTNQLTSVTNMTMPKVQEFRIDANQISSTLPNYDFPACTQFQVSNNQFTGAVPNLQLPSVIYFYIHGNQFTSLPALSFPVCTHFYIYNNLLTGPMPLFVLPEVVIFYAYTNQFTSIPLLDFPKVKNVYIYQNQFTGTMPAFDFPECLIFRAYTNQFTTCSNVTMPKVTEFRIDSAGFTGSLPAFSLPLCRSFWASTNSFSGTCPDLQLPVVENFYIHANDFSGDCPQFDFPACIQFHIHSNNFSGELPAFDLPNAINFYVYGNSFTSIQGMNLPKMKNFYAYQNDFTGTIPAFDFPECVVLRLYNNNFTGIQDMTLPKMTEFRIDYNDIAGQMPAFNFPECTQFHAYFNQFSGPLPKLVMPKLQGLYLFSNAFSGTFPALDCPEIRYFSIYSNQFSGPFPDLDFPDLISFQAHNNQFTSYDNRSVATTVTHFYLYNNLLDAASVDNIVAGFVENIGSRVGALIYAYTNPSGPSAAGQADRATLIAHPTNFTVTLGTEVSLTWPQLMVNNYKARHPHANYSAAVLTELESRLTSGYLYDEFGPESSGQDKKICDFVYLFEFDGDLSQGQITKTGDVLRWDMDGEEYIQDSPPQHDISTGEGIATVSSTDGWTGLTNLRMTNEASYTGFLPWFQWPNLAYLDLNGTSFSGDLPDFFNSTSLDHLYFRNNNFNPGTVNVGDLNALEDLWFDHTPVNELIVPDNNVINDFTASNCGLAMIRPWKNGTAGTADLSSLNSIGSRVELSQNNFNYIIPPEDAPNATAFVMKDNDLLHDVSNPMDLSTFGYNGTGFNLQLNNNLNLEAIYLGSNRKIKLFEINNTSTPPHSLHTVDAGQGEAHTIDLSNQPQLASIFLRNTSMQKIVINDSDAIANFWIDYSANLEAVEMSNVTSIRDFSALVLSSLNRIGPVGTPVGAADLSGITANDNRLNLTAGLLTGPVSLPLAPQLDSTSFFQNDLITSALNSIVTFLFTNRNFWADPAPDIDLRSNAGLVSGTYQQGDLGTYSGNFDDLTEAQIDNLAAGNDYDGTGSNTAWTVREQAYALIEMHTAQGSGTKRYGWNIYLD